MSFFKKWANKAEQLRDKALKSRRRFDFGVTDTFNKTRDSVLSGLRVGSDSLRDLPDESLQRLKDVITPGGSDYQPMQWREELRRRQKLGPTTAPTPTPPEDRGAPFDPIFDAFEEYDKRILVPPVALYKQIRDTLPGPVKAPLISGPEIITMGVEAITNPQKKPFWLGQGELPEEGFINPVKAIYDEDEQERANEIANELDPVTRTLLMLVLDPSNALPVVGFGPDVTRLVRAAKLGGAEGIAALRELTTNPKYMDEVSKGLKRILLEERGSIKVGGGAADEGGEIIRAGGEAERFITPQKYMENFNESPFAGGRQFTDNLGTHVIEEADETTGTYVVRQIINAKGKRLKKGKLRTLSADEITANLTGLENPRWEGFVLPDLDLADEPFKITEEVTSTAGGGTAHVLTGPQGARAEWRERGGIFHLLDVNAGEVEGAGRGTALVQRALDDIAQQAPDARVTADLNTEGGVRVMNRVGATFEDTHGNSLSLDEAIDLAKQGKGPQATVNLAETTRRADDIPIPEEQLDEIDELLTRRMETEDSLGMRPGTLTDPQKALPMTRQLATIPEAGPLAIFEQRPAGQAVSADLEFRARMRSMNQILESGSVTVPTEEVPITLASRTFSQRAKEATLQGRQAEIRNILREEGTIRRRLAQGGLSTEETQSLHDALSLLSAQKKGFREEAELAARTAAEAGKRVAARRAARDLAARTRTGGYTHQRITNKIPTLAEVLNYAFGQSGVQRTIAGVLARVVGSPLKYLDRSLVHENSFVGRYYVAFQQLDEHIQANRELGMRALHDYGNGKGIKVFDVTKDGVERTTGKEISDIIENWDKYKHLFNDEQAGFVDLYRRFRLDVLEDAETLGVRIPNAWKEFDHVWRQVRGKSGVEFQRALQSGARAAGKPGSFRHRIYETLEAGRAANVDYNKDFLQAVEAGAMSISHHATQTAFFKALTDKAPLLSRWVPAALKAERAVAATNYTWSRNVQHYVHQSLRGHPPQPILRNTTGQDVPERLRQIVGEVARINATKKTHARRQAVKPFVEEIDKLVKEYQKTHRTAAKKVRTALESVNRKVTSGEPFGLTGLVEVGSAPPSQFPMLQQRLFLKEDLDYLLKIWDTSEHKLWSASAMTADIFRAGTTALDPGFWFVQGLGAIGTDMANLARGRPSLIWGKSVWRSIRNGVTNGKSANRYWARELRLHRDEMGEFAQFYRNISGHGMPSEFTAALERGGLLERFERHAPGLAQTQPFTRASNAFSFYLDSAAWEMWKSLRPLAKDEKNLAELGAFIRNVTGKTSTKGLGHSQMQRLAERGWVAWAPAYTRGAFAVMIKAITDPTSFGGRQALKSLAGLGVASTLMGGALIMAKQLNKHNGDLSSLEWGKLGEELQSFWNVTDPAHFMSVRMGDNYFGVGGAMRANIAMISRMAKAGYADPANYNPLDIESGHFINFDHPFLRAWRAKSSPLTGQVFNFITGEDYLGFQLDNPAQYFRLSEDVTPFAVQAYLQSEGGIKGKAGAGFAEFLGFRSFPLRKVDLYHEAAEDESGSSWEDLEADGRLDRMREDPENFPETAARWQQYQEELRARGSDIQKARDLTEEKKVERDTKLGDLARNIQWNRPGGGEFYKEQRPVLLAEYRNTFDISAASLGIDLDDLPQSEGKDTVLQSQYYELDVEDFMGPDNKPDWEAFHAKRAELLAQMSPEAQRSVELRKFDFNDPDAVIAERRRLKAVDDLQKWFDIPKYAGLTIEQSDEVDRLLTEAFKIQQLATLQGVRGVDRRDILLAMASSGQADPELASAAVLLTYSQLKDMVINPAPDNWVLSHPDMVVFYPFLFDTLSEEQQVRWQEMNRFSR